MPDSAPDAALAPLTHPVAALAPLTHPGAYPVLRDVAPRYSDLGPDGMISTTGLARWFEDVLESHGDLVDAVKFGWGTCLVTRDVKTKIDVCRAAGVEAYFGGTLFDRNLSAGCD